MVLIYGKSIDEKRLLKVVLSKLSVLRGNRCLRVSEIKTS